VYLFKDARGRTLYIGKAKRLDQRVRGYLADPAALDPRVARMVRQARDLDFVVTESEAAALLLEADWVREQRPLFNIRLKDDKSFPWVKLSVQEEVPRLSLTRKVVDDGARYFGPFTDVLALRRTLRTLRRIYPLRTCVSFERHRREDRPCLNYYIRRCVGPCHRAARVDPVEYRRLVDGMALFWSGHREAARARLEEEMQAAAGRRDYERAAAYRDQLAHWRALDEGPLPIGSGERDADALGVAQQGDDAGVAILQVRGGRVVGRTTRFLRGGRDAERTAVLSQFVAQHYTQNAPARELWLPFALEEGEWLEAALAARGRRVRLRWARRGRARRLAELAQQNAELALEAHLARRARRRARFAPSAYDLQRALGLSHPPHRVACLDVSNLGPADAVASWVVAENGEAQRSAYRRLRLRSVGPDDFAMMREAVTRTLGRVASGEWPRPDLLLVDGGIGQVGAARQGLLAAGAGELPVIGLAKREETVVLADGREIRLPRRTPGLRALMRLRDEAHRFAVRYHRRLRTRRVVRSALDAVAGVGPARRRALLTAFGSVQALAAAEPGEVAARAGVPRAVAERVVAHLRQGLEREARGAAPG
jgi:excinuclease ABC subunit C